MEKRSTFAAMLGSAAFVAVLSGKIGSDGKPQSAPPDKKPAREAPAAAAAPFPGGIRMVGGYLATDSAFALCRQTSKRCYDFDAVIATVPDPYDSQLDWMYDSQLDALRRAFEGAGFVLDRFWLPWPGQADAQPGQVAVRDTVPGLMLFRGASPDKEGRYSLRLLYVVGESPAAGVQTAALTRALRDRAALLAVKPAWVPPLPRFDTVRVVGPAFSGSVAPMGRALDAWLRQPEAAGVRQVRVISGTATRDDNAASLNRVDGRVAFSATVHPLGASLEAAREVLVQRMNVSRAHIALVGESGTAYGQSPQARRLAGVLHVAVPMGMSALRRDDGAAMPDGAGTPAVADGAHPRAAPAVLSAAGPATSVILVNELIQLLRDNDIRAVGLQFTDVRDQLFLAEQIRRRLHDVQVFVLGTNALFLDPARAHYTAGTLSISTYPPFSAGPGWSARERGRSKAGVARERMLFADDRAQGTYNAAVLQLGRGDLLRDYGSPLASGLEHPLGPPLWVSVVGQGSYLPVAALDVGDAHRQALAGGAGVPAPARPEWQRPAFLATDGLFVLGLAILATSVFWAGNQGRRAWELRRAVRRKDARLQLREAVSKLTLVFTPGRIRAGAPGPARARTATTAPAPSTSPAASAAGSGVVALDGSVPSPMESAVVTPTAERAGSGDEARAAAASADPALAGDASAPGTPADAGDDREDAGRPGAKGGKLTAPRLSWVRAQFQQPARSYDRPDRLRESVHEGSLLLHREIYGLVRLVALAGAALPALALLTLNGNVSQATWLFIAIVAAAWTWATVAGLWTAWLVFANYLAEGRAFALSRGWWRRADGRLWALEVVGRAGVATAAVFYLGNTLWYAWELAQLHAQRPLDFALLFRRALALDSGVSPLVPLFLASCGTLVWSTWHAERVRLLGFCTAFEAACLRAPSALPMARLRRERRRHGRPSGREFGELARQLRAELFLMVPREASLLLAALFVLVGAGLWARTGPTLEAVVMLPIADGSRPLVVLLRSGLVLLALVIAGVVLPPRASRVVMPLALVGAATAAATYPEAVRDWLAERYYTGSSFDMLLAFGVMGTLVATSWGVYRLVRVWITLRQFLGAVEETPLRPAMGRLPGRITRLLRLTVLGRGSNASVDHLLIAEWNELRRLYPACAQQVRRLAPGAGGRLDAFMQSRAVWRPRAALAESEPVAERLQALLDTLAALWKAESDAVKVRRLNCDGDLKPDEPAYGAYPAGGWMQRAEDFVALQVVDYTQWALEHLHKLAAFLFVSLLLSTLLLSSYPFPAQSLVKVVFLCVLLATVAALLVVMVQMNRDEILSRISGTEPGKITWDSSFVLNAVVVGVVPLLALLSSEFPAVRKLLFAGLDPLLKSIFGG